jgi:hypothetical protein
MVHSRRSALHVAGGLLVTALAGCATTPAESDSTSSSTVQATATQTGTATSSPPPTSSYGARLTFSGEILRQESTDAPARLEATLSNDGDSTTEVGYGPALLFTANGDADHDWPENLVLDPEGYIGPWDDPVQTDDGCWRFPEDGERLVQASLNWHELAPGDSVTQAYDLYTRSDAETCLPAGTYRFQDGGFVDQEDQPLTFTLTLYVDDGRRLTGIEGRLDRPFS